MYKSVSFWRMKNADNGRNTWTSWKLIPSSRPQIAPPSQKTVYEEIPYRDGKYDFSMFGMDEPAFNNREGSLEFIATNPNIYGYKETHPRRNDGDLIRDYDLEYSINTPDKNGFEHWSWSKTYSTIMGYLQGQDCEIVLEDDPGYKYTGKTEVEAINSEDAYTTYSVKYDLEPYKKQRFSTTQKWVWDAIDFEDNPDIKGLTNIEIYSSAMTNHEQINGIHTLSKKIIPKITISDIKDKNGNVVHSANGKVLVNIYDGGLPDDFMLINDSTHYRYLNKPSRQVILQKGTNNPITNTNNITISNGTYQGSKYCGKFGVNDKWLILGNDINSIKNINNLYFPKDSKKLAIVLVPEAGHYFTPTFGFSINIDYRVEGL